MQQPAMFEVATCKLKGSSMQLRFQRSIYLASAQGHRLSFHVTEMLRFAAEFFHARGHWAAWLKKSIGRPGVTRRNHPWISWQSGDVTDCYEMKLGRRPPRRTAIGHFWVNVGEGRATRIAHVTEFMCRIFLGQQQSLWFWRDERR